MNKKVILLILLILLIIGVNIMAGINHVDVKASGQKGYAAEWNKDHVQTGNHDCAKFQHENHVIENRVAFPGGPVAGQIIYRTDLKAMYIFDGTNWSRSNKRVLYWTCSGANFLPSLTLTHLFTNDVYLNFRGMIHPTVNNVDFMAPVFLPEGAIVTAVKVYGNVNDETWKLYRASLANPDGDFAEMATALLNTEDNTIANATIDNTTYSYTLWVESMDINDKIYGARITYTL